MAAGCTRRAVLECINEAEGTVDVAFTRWKVADPRQAAEAAEPNLAHLADQVPDDEATVPVSQVKPLQDFELRQDSELCAMFADDLAHACGKIKEEANVLFKLSDHDAAAAHYSRALQRLLTFSSESCRARETLVLVNSSGALVKGLVAAVDTEKRTADVDLLTQARSGARQVRRVPWRTLCVVRTDQLQLQTSLYLNRARCLMHLQRHQEAAWDLSVVIASLQQTADPTWSLGDLLSKVGWLPCRSCSRRRQERAFVSDDDLRQLLVKAHFLRAKTRLSRLKLVQARADLAKAWSLRPLEEMVKELRTLEQKIEAAHKQEAASNKRLRREMCKLADAAMSNLTEQQMSSLAGVMPPANMPSS